VLRELVLRMGRRLRRHLTLAVADAPSRLEAERRGLLAFPGVRARHPDLYRVVAESQFVDQAVFRRYYEEFAGGISAACAPPRSAANPQGRRRGARLGADGHLRHGWRRFACGRQDALKRVADAAFALIARGWAPVAIDGATPDPLHHAPWVNLFERWVRGCESLRRRNSGRFARREA